MTKYFMAINLEKSRSFLSIVNESFLIGAEIYRHYCMWNNNPDLCCLLCVACKSVLTDCSNGDISTLVTCGEVAGSVLSFVTLRPNIMI